MYSERRDCFFPSYYVETLKRVNEILVYSPSVFQTLQTTDPGAEGEPLENHAKVRQTAKVRRCVWERKEEENGKDKICSFTHREVQLWCNTQMLPDITGCLRALPGVRVYPWQVFLNTDEARYNSSVLTVLNVSSLE